MDCNIYEDYHDASTQWDLPPTPITPSTQNVRYPPPFDHFPSASIDPRCLSQSPSEARHLLHPGFLPYNQQGYALSFPNLNRSIDLSSPMTDLDIPANSLPVQIEDAVLEEADGLSELMHDKEDRDAEVDSNEEINEATMEVDLRARSNSGRLPFPARPASVNFHGSTLLPSAVIKTPSLPAELVQPAKEAKKKKLQEAPKTAVKAATKVVTKSAPKIAEKPKSKTLFNTAKDDKPKSGRKAYLDKLRTIDKAVSDKIKKGIAAKNKRKTATVVATPASASPPEEKTKLSKFGKGLTAAPAPNAKASMLRLQKTPPPILSHTSPKKKAGDLRAPDHSVTNKGNVKSKPKATSLPSRAKTTTTPAPAPQCFASKGPGKTLPFAILSKAKTKSRAPSPPPSPPSTDSGGGSEYAPSPAAESHVSPDSGDDDDDYNESAAKKSSGRKGGGKIGEVDGAEKPQKKRGKKYGSGRQEQNQRAQAKYRHKIKDRSYLLEVYLGRMLRLKKLKLSARKLEEDFLEELSAMDAAYATKFSEQYLDL